MRPLLSSVLILAITPMRCFTSGRSWPFLDTAMYGGVSGGIMSIHGRFCARACGSMLPGRVVAVIESRVGIFEDPAPSALDLRVVLERRDVDSAGRVVRRHAAVDLKGRR